MLQEIALLKHLNLDRWGFGSQAVLRLTLLNSLRSVLRHNLLVCFLHNVDIVQITKYSILSNINNDNMILIS